MHYVCIENNAVTSILNYRPNVPKTVEVVEISDAEHEQCVQGTHYFNVIQRKVVSQDKRVIDQQQVEKQNAIKQHKLQSTDWIVLRHIREKALGLPTSISEDEYIKMEEERQEIAKSIVNL